MKNFPNKYGFIEDKNTKQFHRSRRMFCIYNNELIIAKRNLEYSHAKWFEKEGWITEEDQNLMENGVRGYVDCKENIYFYTGYDFRIDEKIEDIFFRYLDELIDNLKINRRVCKIFGGMRKEKNCGKWVPQKEYKGVLL